MTKWIVPCNPKYYDVEGAFASLPRVEWKQSNPNICEGDVVYLYVGSPIRAIKYKCNVTKANLSTTVIDDSAFVIDGDVYSTYPRHMELELIKKYDDNVFSYAVLSSHGMKGRVQCPRRITDELDEFIKAKDN